MKRAFARMNFPRAVILFCSLGSLVLGVFVFLRTQRLNEVKAELVRVEEVLREMQADAYRLDSLQRRAGSEKFKAQSEPEMYIRSLATGEHINLGSVDVNKRPDTPMKGVEDMIYTVKPTNKAQRRQRIQVGNFLYKLEADSSRVKVTRIKLTPAEKLAPGEIGKDEWLFEIDLITRTKLDSAPAPAPNEG